MWNVEVFLRVFSHLFLRKLLPTYNVPDRCVKVLQYTAVIDPAHLSGRRRRKKFSRSVLGRKRTVTHLLRGCYTFSEHFFPSSRGASALARIALRPPRLRRNAATFSPVPASFSLV